MSQRASTSPSSAALYQISLCCHPIPDYMDLPIYEISPGYAPGPDFPVSWFSRFAVFLPIMQILPTSRFHFFSRLSRLWISPDFPITKTSPTTSQMFLPPDSRFGQFPDFPITSPLPTLPVTAPSPISLLEGRHSSSQNRKSVLRVLVCVALICSFFVRSPSLDVSPPPFCTFDF